VPEGSAEYGDDYGGCQPERTTVGSRIDAACDAEICVDPTARWLTSMGVPDGSTLWYSQKRSWDVLPPPVTVQPAGEMWLPIVQLTYATWLAGYTLSSIRASTWPVMPESAVSFESTKT
jgi:hypothetical protein